MYSEKIRNAIIEKVGAEHFFTYGNTEGEYTYFCRSAGGKTTHIVGIFKNDKRCFNGRKLHELLNSENENEMISLINKMRV